MDLGVGGPAMRLTDGSPGSSLSLTSYNGYASFGTTFSSFNDQAGSSIGAVDLKLSGTMCTGGDVLDSFTNPRSPDFTVMKGAVAFVGVVPRTSKVYVDAPVVSLQYYLRDAVGHAQVVSENLTVYMQLEVEGMVLRSECSAPNATSGAAECRHTLSGDILNAFTMEEGELYATVVAMYGGRQVALSESQVVQLAPRAMHPSLEEVGMVVAMPESPRFAGESFTTVVHANTGGYPLITFGLVIKYASNILQFQSYAGDAKYESPDVNTWWTGDVIVSTSGLAHGVDDLDVTGADITVFSITFNVVATESGVFSDVLNCTILEMVSRHIDTLTTQAALVTDARDGAFYSAELEVVEHSIVGIYAYANSAEIVNTAIFNGIAQQRTVTVMKVWSKFGTEAEADGAERSCVVYQADGDWDPRNTLGTSASDSCVVEAAEHHRKGLSSVRVDATLAGASDLHGSLFFRVWFPSAVSMSSTDSELGAIYGMERPGQCGAQMFQDAQVSVFAQFSVNDGRVAPIDNVHVSCFSMLTSSHPSVASVEGTTISGWSPGSATISVGGEYWNEAGRTRPTMMVDVVADAVYTAQISAVLITGARWEMSSTSLQRDPTVEGSTMRVEASLAQALNKEGDEGVIYTYAFLSDGRYIIISSDDGLVVSLEDGGEAFLNVKYEELNGETYPVGYVPTGAVSGGSDSLMRVAWANPCRSDTVIAQGSGGVNVVLATPAYAVINATCTRLTHRGDVSVEPLTSIPTFCRYTVVMFLSDDTTVDMTQDERTVLNVTDGSSHLELFITDITEYRAVRVPHDSTTTGEATLHASFQDYTAAASITATLVFTVVQAEYVALWPTPWPAYDGSSGIWEDVLSPICGSNIYQRARVKLYLFLTDGSRWDVSEGTEFSSDNAYILGVDTDVLVPTGAAGSASVKGAYFGMSSTSVDIEVTSVALDVTAIEHSTVWEEQHTFSALAGTERLLQIAVTLGDGTHLEDVVGGAQTSWLPASSVANFVSSRTEVIDLSAEGVATLHGNYPEEIELNAIMRCGSWLSAADNVWANTLPAEHDVKLGNQFGAQVDATASGELTDIPVYVETGNGTLNVFDLLLSFNDNHLRATACDQGTGWDNSFTCTINDPRDEVLITGVEISTNASGLVHVATVTIYVEGGFEQSAITTTIQGLEIDTADGIVRYDQSQVSASGYAYVAVADRRRHALSSGAAYTLAHESRMAQQQTAMERIKHRQLLQDASDDPVWGDLDGDGRFNCFDVQDLQRWVLEMPGYLNPEENLTAVQREYLDPTLDFIVHPDDTSACPDGWTGGTPCPTPKDKLYLHLVYANYLRFVAVSNARPQYSPEHLVQEPEYESSELEVLVSVFDKYSQLSTDTTKIRFELRTSLNDQMEITVGYDTQRYTNDTVAVTAISNGESEHYIRAAGPRTNDGKWYNESDMGVAIYLVTRPSSVGYEESTALTDVERSYCFMGCVEENFEHAPIVSFEVAVKSDLPSPPPPFPRPPPTPPPPRPFRGKYRPPPSPPPTPPLPIFPPLPPTPPGWDAWPPPARPSKYYPNPPWTTPSPPAFPPEAGDGYECGPYPCLTNPVVTDPVVTDPGSASSTGSSGTSSSNDSNSKDTSSAGFETAAAIACAAAVAATVAAAGGYTLYKRGMKVPASESSAQQLQQQPSKRSRTYEENPLFQMSLSNAEGSNFRVEPNDSCTSVVTQNPLVSLRDQHRAAGTASTDFFSGIDFTAVRNPLTIADAGSLDDTGEDFPGPPPPSQTSVLVTNPLAHPLYSTLTADTSGCLFDGPAPPLSPLVSPVASPPPSQGHVGGGDFSQLNYDEIRRKLSHH